MAEELTENDTFVSVDIFAPTQSSLGAPDLEPNLPSPQEDSTSLSEFFQNETSQHDDNHNFHQFDDTAAPSNSSFQDNHSMRFNTNCQDSAFIWSLTKNSSPEALRRPEADIDVDDTLSIGDDGDICGSFDTTTFDANHFDQPESFSLGCSPSGPFATPTHHTDVASSHEFDHQTSDPSALLCSSERPPLPPAGTSSATPIPLSSTPSPKNIETPFNDIVPDLGEAQDQFTMISGEERRVSVTEHHNGRCDSRLLEASRGFSTCTISNPFASNEASDDPKELVVISRIGDLLEDEKDFLRDLAIVDDSPNVRLLKRLFDTVAFQRQQLDAVKDSEVNLAESVLQHELRRYSDVAQERSFAMSALVEEVDAQQKKVTELEDENEKLRRLLEESKNKNFQVENYYSQFVTNFKLSDDVIPDLEKVNQNMERLHRESIEAAEEKDNQIEDYARRLLQMEDIASDARKRMQQLEAENSELRAIQLGRDGATDDNDVLKSPFESKHEQSSPFKADDAERNELLQRIDELEVQVDNLRELNRKGEEDYLKVQDAFLSINVDMEEAKSKVQTLHKQRNAAECKNRELHANAVSEKRKFIEVTNEMSRSLVQTVSDLDQRESDLRILRSELEDRESAFRSLQCTNQDLEDHLQALTEAALDRSRSRNAIDAAHSQSSVDIVIEGLQEELGKAQSLLEVRAMDLDKVKKSLLEQEEANIALQKECSRLQAAMAVRRHSGSLNSPGPTGSERLSEERFLRRLSEKLGCNSSNSRELIEQLAKRIELMMAERAELQELSDAMRKELNERERSLHKLRSEMQAEISTLKSEAAHLENLKTRAQDELKVAESRLLQLCNENDLSRRESMGDITVSSVGTRGWFIGDDADVSSRRGSMISSAGGEDTIRWSDPIINAAVQSVSALIGTKDALAARNRELREKLQNMINSLPNIDDDGAVRSIMIQSKELQEELTGVVGMQQDIIKRLSTGQHSGIITTELASGDETLPLIQSGQGNGQGTMESGSENLQVTASRVLCGESTRFLNEQLSSTRALYAEKIRANVELCNMVDELRNELQYSKTSNINFESALLKLQETHGGFLQRLSEITGAEKSIVSLEDFIRAALNDNAVMEGELDRREVEEKVSCKRTFGLLAQKRVLAHIIGLYQYKYRLNILARSSEEEGSPRRRLRVAVFAVVAALKLRRICMLDAEPSIHMSEEYDVPEEIDISHTERTDYALLESSIAIAAVPRLEEAVIEKEKEIARLEATVNALNRSAAAQLEAPAVTIGDIPRSSYVYEEDVLSRKNDLSRRLQRIINEKEELEGRLSKEKDARLNVEAKAARYAEKLSTYKKRLEKTKSYVEAKENAYKAAIRYLKNKADKAVSNDFNLDEENIAPLDNEQENENDWIDDRSFAEPALSAKALMQSTLRKVEKELADMQRGTAMYDEKKKYLNGLKRTIQHLERGTVLTKRPQDVVPQ